MNNSNNSTNSSTTKIKSNVDGKDISITLKRNKDENDFSTDEDVRDDKQISIMKNKSDSGDESDFHDSMKDGKKKQKDDIVESARRINHLHFEIKTKNKELIELKERYEKEQKYLRTRTKNYNTIFADIESDDSNQNKEKIMVIGRKRRTNQDKNERENKKNK